jgi:hypothetical protein
MHLTVCCRFLICCVMHVFCPGGGGGGGWNMVVKLLYDPVFRVIMFCMNFKISRRASEPNIRSTWDSNP